MATNEVIRAQSGSEASGTLKEWEQEVSFPDTLEEVRLGFVKALIISFSRCSKREGREGINFHTGKGLRVISLSPWRMQDAPVMYLLQLW